MPKVSITMCTRNRADFLPKAVESVQKQTFTDWELIIVDDGSTDDSEEYLNSITEQDSRVKVYKNKESIGIPKSRNLATKYASGEYIAVIDSDDEWSSVEKLEKQVKFLDTHPEYAVVGTFANRIDKNETIIGKIEYHTDNKNIRDNILLRNQFCHSSILFRKKLFDVVGGYELSHHVLEDYDLLLRLGNVGKYANLSDTLTNYRTHGANITKRKLQTARQHLKVIRQYKNIYPYYTQARIKGWLRVLKAFF